MMTNTTKLGKFQGRICSVSIEGFRSLSKIEHLELPQLTVLIGANGAGKSNFIRFFDLLGWMLRGQNLQEFILRQGGGDDQLFMGARKTNGIKAEIGIETQSGLNDYRFTLAHLSATDMLMVMDEAYRYSAKKKFPSEASWTKLLGPGREAAILERTDPTALAVVVPNFDKRFVLPYIQYYEFEGLLFSDVA